MCDKGFNTNYLLKKHMQKAHDLELTEKAPRADQVIIAQQQMEDVSMHTDIETTLLSCVSLIVRVNYI